MANYLPMPLHIIIPTPGPPSDVMVSNIVYSVEQANVTIEWTPPTNGGNVMYTIGTTPAPLSGAIPDTDSTHISITVNYKTNYMVTVAINTTCHGVQEAITTFNIGGLVSLYLNSIIYTFQLAVQVLQRLSME